MAGDLRPAPVMSRRSSSKLKTMKVDSRILLQLPRLGLANEDQLEFLDLLFPNGGVPAMQALLNLMHCGVVDGVIWKRESWVGDSVGSVTGVDGDKLDLLNPVAMPPTGGCNLMYTEGVVESMMNQLHESVEKAMVENAGKSDPMEKLAEDVPRQVCMLVQRIRWTTEVQKCIRENRQLSIVTRSNNALRLKINEFLLKDELPLGTRSTLRALQQVIHEQQRVLNLLCGLKSQEEVDGAWKAQWKFMYDDKENVVEVKFDDRTIKIGHEYSPPRMLVSTDFTQVLRWAYTNAFSESGSRLLVLIGPPGCGKTGMLTNVGQLLGTLPTIIRCNETLPETEEWWMRHLKAAIISGGSRLAPVILTQAHRSSSAAIQMALAVAQKLNDNPPEECDSSDAGIALCVTMVPGVDKDRLCCASGPLAGCQTINVPASDLKVIASGQLAAEGLKDVDALAGPISNVLLNLQARCSVQAHYDFGPRTLVQLCTQIGEGIKGSKADEKDVVATVLERCLTPKLVKEDLKFLQEELETNFGVKRILKAPSEAEMGRWARVAESINSITKVEPDCMVLPVAHEELDVFFEEFCKMLNRRSNCMVKLPGKLSDMTAEDLFGKMPKKVAGSFEGVQDGKLVKVLRQAMEDYVDSSVQVWIAMETGNITPAQWECLHELLNDSGCINLPTGEQLRLNSNLRFLFVMQNAANTPVDTFSRSAVVWTDPPF